MPVKKVRGGWRWGRQGAIYPSREQAVKQGRAIEARKAKSKKKG